MQTKLNLMMLKPDLDSFYAIHPANVLGLLYSSRSPLRVLALTHWLRRMRYLELRQCCLVKTYELTRTSHHCGQQLPSIHTNYNAAS